MTTTVINIIIASLPNSIFDNVVEAIDMRFFQLLCVILMVVTISADILDNPDCTEKTYKAVLKSIVFDTNQEDACPKSKWILECASELHLQKNQLMDEDLDELNLIELLQEELCNTNDTNTEEVDETDEDYESADADTQTESYEEDEDLDEY